jgi:uncharacterized protein YwgA
MTAYKQYAITLALAKELWKQDSWCGETHLQKSMFFLETLGDASIGYHFILYKHGPYSFDFHDHLDELKALGLIDLEYTPPYGPRYKVTERGEWLIRDQQIDSTPHRVAITTTANCLGAKKVKELEQLGTALLVWKENQTAPTDARAHRLTILKPHISPEEATKATQEFETILPCFQQHSCHV